MPHIYADLNDDAVVLIPAIGSVANLVVCVAVSAQRWLSVFCFVNIFAGCANNSVML